VQQCEVPTPAVVHHLRRYAWDYRVARESENWYVLVRPLQIVVMEIAVE